MNTNTQHDNDNDKNNDMPIEIDFSNGKRGQFYQANAQFNFPVYLEQQVQHTLAALASAKGIDFSVLINNLLKKDIELIEMAR